MTSGLLILLWALIGFGAGGPVEDGSSSEPAGEAVCVVADVGPEYYRIDLVPTRRIPGSASIRAYGDVYFEPSPFGVAVTAEGHYSRRVDISATGMPERPNAEYVVWITSPSLDYIERVGTLDNGRISTPVSLNKYLVVVTLEKSGFSADRWEGPVVMRGMSRSGLMHTMAGHGPFESEPCAQYGFR